MIGFSVFAGLVIAPTAIGATLNAGDILQIGFSTTAPVCPSGACDVLELFPNEAGSFFATNVTASLFNGNTLLGTYFSAFCCVPTFRSPSSLFQAGSATADFTAIDAGITNGIIDMSLGTGFLTWPAEPTPNLLIGHATGPGSVLGGTGIQVTSVAIVPAPEPSTFSALLGGLVFLGFRHRKLMILGMAFSGVMRGLSVANRSLDNLDRDGPQLA
jgi:hypothetical protein